MRKLIVFAVMLAAGCKPVSVGPFRSMMALERWHRVDPPAEHTMTVLATMHRDDRLPSWKALDERCTLGTGTWADADVRPPSFGRVRMQIGDRREVVWAEDPYGEARWEDKAEALAWDSGERLRVVVEGGEAPGFEVDVVMPVQVELTSHDLRALAANQWRLSRAEPLELRWVPTRGEVYLLFLQFLDNNRQLRQRALSCAFPAASGSLTLSPQILGNLIPTAANIGTNIYFGGGVQQVIEREGFEIEIDTFKNEAARIQVE